MYPIISIKTANIAVDNIGKITCSHLLAYAQTYFYVKLLCMHDAVTSNIVATRIALYSINIKLRDLVRAHCALSTIFLPAMFAC